MAATQLLGDKYLGLTTCSVLPVNTRENSWVEKKRHHSPSHAYLSTIDLNCYSHTLAAGV